MPKVSMFDKTGKELSQIELSESVFGIEPNTHVMHEMVLNYLANQRQGTQSTLTRSEVAGGGKKPWRQKGTGNARHGSTRSPIWRHGGVALGPKPRSYNYTLNRKERRIGMKSALSTKVIDGDMIVVDKFDFDEYKTKNMIEVLNALGVEKKALIVLDERDEKVIKSAANIPGIKTAYVNTINVHDILNYDKFIVLESAVNKIEEVYA